MTNRERFVEVFGFKPDCQENILPCGAECPLYTDCQKGATCLGWSWWDREYHACEQCLHYNESDFNHGPCMEGLEDRWQKKET